MLAGDDALFQRSIATEKRRASPYQPIRRNAAVNRRRASAWGAELVRANLSAGGNAKSVEAAKPCGREGSWRHPWRGNRRAIVIAAQSDARRWR